MRYLSKQIESDEKRSIDLSKVASLEPESNRQSVNRQDCEIGSNRRTEKGEEGEFSSLGNNKAILVALINNFKFLVK